MKNVLEKRINEEIVSYWDNRSASYSNGVRGELSDNRREMWRRELMDAAAEVFSQARREERMPHVLDLGCGPGFFTALFCEADCLVDAVDSSTEMLIRARENTKEDSRASFTNCNFTKLPFSNDAFDLAVARNVTWLMQDPIAAYEEWVRVLRPGGKLLVFDASWYRYLADADVAALRTADQENNVLEGWDEEAQATSDEEKRCEEIAKELPLTYELRPAWDVDVLSGLGVSQAIADDNVWKRVWTNNEQSYYRATPMFLVSVTK